jgi:hypothetical protein
MTHLSFNTCRFCDDRDQSMVKYGVRHYAHYRCYLDAGKSLDDLHPWQARQFPYRLLKERGLLSSAALREAAP